VVSCTDKDAGPLATEMEAEDNEMIIANPSSSDEIDGQIFYVWKKCPNLEKEIL